VSDRRDTEVSSFDAFFRSTKKPLLAMAYVLTGDALAAQDLAQEAFLRTWERWPRIRRYDNPEAWTRRVLRNLVVDRSRSEKVRTAVTDPGHPIAPPDDLALSLAATLRSLPADQMTALVLHDGAGMTIREIALQMAVPEGTVKSWLSRGRASAAAALNQSPTPREEGHARQ